MHKKLLIQAFEKATEIQIKQGISTPSKSHLATILSDFILENSSESFGVRSLRNYYKTALGANENEDIELKSYVIKSLCEYLNYEDYSDFILKNNLKKKDDDGGMIILLPEGEVTRSNAKTNTKTFIIENKIILSICLFVIISIISINSFNQQRWMAWEGNRYTEVPFDSEKFKNGQLLPYNETLFKYFKKVNPDSIPFFNKDGSARVWYGKNIQGELEYFIALGRHPETRKTLKPITQYMIDKYVRTP